jgi:hypothetical protein
MATIYETGDNRLLVIGPRESLIYPFNIGGWNRIRLGVGMSISLGDTMTGVPVYENYFVNMPRSAFYLGLKSDGPSLPFTSGCYYIGVGNPSGDRVRFFSQLPNSVLRYGNNYGGNECVASFGSITTSARPIQEIRLPTNVNMATGINYGAILGFEFKKYISGSNEGVSLAVGDPSIVIQTNDFSVSNLRSQIANFSQQTPNVSGLLKTHLATTGNALPSPDNFFIYNGSTTNGLKIHAILIDKYE